MDACFRRQKQVTPLTGSGHGRRLRLSMREPQKRTLRIGPLDSVSITKKFATHSVLTASTNSPKLKQDPPSVGAFSPEGAARRSSELCASAFLTPHCRDPCALRGKGVLRRALDTVVLTTRQNCLTRPVPASMNVRPVPSPLSCRSHHAGPGEGAGKYENLIIFVKHRTYRVVPDYFVCPGSRADPEARDRGEDWEVSSS